MLSTEQFHNKYINRTLIKLFLLYIIIVKKPIHYNVNYVLYYNIKFTKI